MEYYCIMVLTGEEKKFKERALEAFRDCYPTAQFYFFERKLFTKKRGWFDAPLFPGYLFFSVEAFSREFFDMLRKIKGFCRVLPENQEPQQIKGDALDELKLFIGKGEHWGISRLQFAPGQKIKAISGPLVGYEGNIVMVNKKRKQITVQSSLTGTAMRFDLKYEDAEKVEEN